MTLFNRYKNALESIPAPGSGCHPALLGVANYGVMAGLTDWQIFTDIRRSIPKGNRDIPDQEIHDAISKAKQDSTVPGDGSGHKPAPVPPKPQPAVKLEYLHHLLKQGKGISEQDITKTSPVRLLGVSRLDVQFLLRTLYDPDDILFLGELYDTEVKPVKEWLSHIQTHGTEGLPHIIPNSLTGEQHPKQNGKLSYRCDAAVKDFRYAVVEFDNLSREDQLAFWAAVPLPVSALIDSGGKSIHGWIRTRGITSADEWTQKIENELYARRLVPLGVDSACRNESRLSRLPGHLRVEKDRWQRLLYLNPDPTPTPIIESVAVIADTPRHTARITCA